jgi:hypothetical protein
LRKFSSWSHEKRALSPIFATVLLASIIIAFGSVAYYYSSNLTRNATNDYVKTLSDSQQAMSERIAFENVVYSSSPNTLKIYVLNCGSANNIKINSIFLYDENHAITGGSPYSGSTISVLKTIEEDTPIADNSLNVGKEGYFTVTLSTSLVDPFYTIHLITQSGSYFDYDFSP